MPEKNIGGQKRDAFIMLPKKLLNDERYNSLSSESVMMYALLADRASLSEKNGWVDDDGRVFIYFTVNEMAQVIGCCRDKVIACFKELERLGLINRRRQGQGKASVIYVNPAIGCADFKKQESPTSESREIRFQEVEKPDTNNTYYNNNEFNNTYLSFGQEGYDEMRSRVEEQLDYEYLCTVRDKNQVDELIMLMCDTLCGSSAQVRIGGQMMPKSVVEARFAKLDCEHICYVIDAFSENTTNVRSIRSYLLTALYNAPATMDHYYQALVNRDFAQPK